MGIAKVLSVRPRLCDSVYATQSEFGLRNVAPYQNYGFFGLNMKIYILNHNFKILHWIFKVKLRITKSKNPLITHGATFRNLNSDIKNTHKP